MPATFWRCGLAGALAIYCLLAILAIRERPGLYYDEALLVLGSVQMRISPAELTLPHDPDTWITVFGQSIPLMTVRYVGAIKEYLCVPVFSFVAHRTSAVRVVSMLLGLLGIWGLAKLVREQAGLPAAVLVATAIAINPAYVYQTVFDGGTVSIWMAALGLLSIAISRYIRRKNAAAAFWLGAAMGFGIWARANFLWLLAAVCLAAAIALGRRLLLPASHWVAVVAGGIIGGFPFLLYQIVSRGGSWEALSMFSAQGTIEERILTRVVMFSETLLSDREHRAMWGGPMMPPWQRWLFPLIVLICCAAPFLVRTDRHRPDTILARIFALTFLFFGATLMLSGAPVAEHHLIGLLPLAVALIMLVCWNLGSRSRSAAFAMAGLGLIYVGSAMYWQVAAIQGLHRTGGVGPWSDGVNPLAVYLVERRPTSEAKILDWGLQDNLFVISDGAVRSREIFWDATEQQSGLRQPWLEEIRQGGVFVMNAAGTLQMPVATTAFLKTLTDAHPVLQRHTFRGRNGVPYAEVVDIEPGSVGKGPVAQQAMASTISLGDARFADRLSGFYQIEEQGWRWSSRQFSITLASLGPAVDARLTVQIYIPASVLEKIGAITLGARIGDHQLRPETYRQPGEFTFVRDVDADWMSPGQNRVAFTLDKSLPPTPSDQRELGIIVKNAALEQR
jgi:hypothetical protein